MGGVWLLLQLNLQVATPPVAPPVAQLVIVGVDVDDDVEKAVVALWISTPALASLFAHAPRSGRIHSTKTAPQSLPYAQVASEHSKSERGFGYCLDRRKVTLTMRGTRAQAVQAMGQALGVFNARLGYPDGSSPTLTMPSKARFIKWWPLNEGTTKQEETQVQGVEVWAAVIEGEVTTVRVP